MLQFNSLLHDPYVTRFTEFKTQAHENRHQIYSDLEFSMYSN